MESIIIGTPVIVNALVLPKMTLIVLHKTEITCSINGTTPNVIASVRAKQMHNVRPDMPTIPITNGVQTLVNASASPKPMHNVQAF